jgi:hypothetical protein
MQQEARVRFTVDLPLSIHKRLKLAAVERELPMTDLARQALVEWPDHLEGFTATDALALELDLTLSECCDRWGVSSRNSIKARAAALGVELRRESSTRTVWPSQFLALGDDLDAHLRNGGTLASFPSAQAGSFGGAVQENGCIGRAATDPTSLAPTMSDLEASLVPLQGLIESLPLSRGSVFELIKALGITTQTGQAPGGKGRAAWLSSADANRLRDAAGAVARKEARIADFFKDTISSNMNTTSDANDEFGWLAFHERSQEWEKKLESIPMNWRAPIIDVVDTIGLLKQGLMVHGIDDAIVLIEAARMAMERHDKYSTENDVEFKESAELQCLPPKP